MGLISRERFNSLSVTSITFACFRNRHEGCNNFEMLFKLPVSAGELSTFFNDNAVWIMIFGI